MKMLYLLIIMLSVTWADPTNYELPDDSVVTNEEEDPGMSRMQLRVLPDNKDKLVETFSRRKNSKGIAYEPERFFKGILDVQTSAYQNAFNDPYWKYQWYQQDYRTAEQVKLPSTDHNVVPVQRMGFNGKGITIGILGERLSAGMHPDMGDRVKGIFNAVKKTSNIVGKEPRLPGEDETLPPTTNLTNKMAGVIAMNANNSRCGVGIAYNAKLVGITVKEDGKPLNDDDIVTGLKHDLTSLHIYVDAVVKMHDGMSLNFSKQIRNGLKIIATDGRGGNGGIYVVGAGDGSESGDHCGADDIVNSIHTFAIASVNWRRNPTFYSEICSAIIATAYSTYSLISSRVVPGVVSIDGDDSCTKNFGGTAASAAIASGIFALTLQANPDLTWRDLMHLIAMTSERAPLEHNPVWEKNAAGFWVSHYFGFGLLNAENMVLASKQWTLVPKMKTCKRSFKNLDSLREGSTSRTTLVLDDCPSLNDAEAVKYIEQVELVATILTSDIYRSDISITLISPKGTESQLFENRRKDLTLEGFNSWSMRSLHFWGEQPFGTWALQVKVTRIQRENEKMKKKTADGKLVKIADTLDKTVSLIYTGDKILSARLLIHGTSDFPNHYLHTPPDQRRKYAH